MADVRTQKRKVRKKRPVAKLNKKMRGKLLALFIIVLLAMVGLIVQLVRIEYINGDKYEKKVLALQSYDSKTIPYRRGDILDCNGTVLATSVAVYNVVLDCYVMTSKEQYIEPTIDALVACYPDLERSELESYAQNQKDNRYMVLKKKISYDEMQAFVDLQEEEDEKGNKVNPNINGVWFEKEYQRVYPYNSLAASVIGFTSAGDVGTTGLENYYDDELNGINGRQYGYLNSDNYFQKTVIEAEDGNNLVCSIDENIQAIIEEKIKEYYDAYTDNYRVGGGAENIAVLIMNPNTGEIYGMADYPEFDLNNPRDLSFMYTEEELEAMTDEETLDILNGLWQNYCVTETFEPGSVQKAFTIAAGLESGTVTEDMTFLCDGYEQVGGHTIGCVNRSGHGIETVRDALLDSCNDALMQMSYLIGTDEFVTTQEILGFGQKTGIDLPGEANTSTLVFTRDNMKPVDLATNSFGQNYNCTMVQMTSAFASLINGGTYYQPHVVKRITDSEGNTITEIEPVVLKQTFSKATSDILKEYLYGVVSEGTGKTAKVDGYSMGGKTGTAQMYDEETHLRKQGCYVLSFMGFVPYENPELVIYCIIDQPNAADQSHSSHAQNLVREILEEVLPYMNIYPDEELTGINADLPIYGTDVLSGHVPYQGTDRDPNLSTYVPPESTSEPTAAESQPEEATPEETVPEETIPQEPQQ